MSELRLFTIDLPEEIVFPEEPNASGDKPDCPECGRDWMKGFNDGGVWDYHVHNEGIAIWVRAVCRECKTVHIFTTSGGKSGGGSGRELRDLSRKHGEEWRHHSK